MDPYQPCYCGSGKNFKWCCQSYYQTVEKARAQHNQGQHETALRTIAQLVQQNPGNASVLGFQAELLYLNGKLEEADESIQKALAINPNFPLGHWLRGVIRKDEGEIVGALLQFRKAAELYDPKSVEILAEIYASIFDIELRLNRPVAGRAALEFAIRCQPATNELRQALEDVFGAESRFPEVARKPYAFRAAPASRAESWAAAFPTQKHGRFADALTAFRHLTKEDENDASAWFNLGLASAWLGDLPSAVEALLRSIDLETDDEKNTEAGALCEVLRCGAGMEEEADYLEHRAYFKFQDPEAVSRLFQSWSQESRITSVDQDQENGTISALVLEKTSQLGVGFGSRPAKVGAYLLLVGDVIRLWNVSKDEVTKIATEVAEKLGGAVAPVMHQVGCCNFADVTLEALVIPTGEVTFEGFNPKFAEHQQTYFEEVWANRPLKSLAGVTPLDATAHPGFRKRLFGMVRFLEDCSDRRGLRFEGVPLYDFNRLRRKLGLGGPPVATVSDSEPKIDEFSVAELAGLDAGKLSDEQLEKAFRASLKLDARELAGHFAQTLVKRPTNAAIPDRYPFFHHLMQLAQAENNSDAVMKLLDSAEIADAELNGGKRRGDYALRRAQTYAKRGEAETAYQVLKALLAANADEVKYFGTATETMLSQKKGQWALEFAEAGLAKARSQNNRDSEQYLMELAAAARKQLA